MAPAASICPCSTRRTGSIALHRWAPALAPTFTPQQASGVDYPIVNITQPAAKSDPGDPGHINTLQQSAGPTSTAPGNTITVFYANSLHYPEDTDLVDAFNSGNPVYVYVSGTSLTAANITALVTGIGNATPPGASNFRWYFTYQVGGAAAYQQFGGPDDSAGTYQRTLATLTTTNPVPNLEVGDQITITGNSVSAWNAAWTVSQTPNASEMAITGSAVASGVATLNYSVTGASSPPSGGAIGHDHEHAQRRRRAQRGQCNHRLRNRWQHGHIHD